MRGSKVNRSAPTLHDDPADVVAIGVLVFMVTKGNELVEEVSTAFELIAGSVRDIPSQIDVLLY